MQKKSQHLMQTHLCSFLFFRRECGICRKRISLMSYLEWNVRIQFRIQAVQFGVLSDWILPLRRRSDSNKWRNAPKSFRFPFLAQFENSMRFFNNNNRLSMAFDIIRIDWSKREPMFHARSIRSHTHNCVQRKVKPIAIIQLTALDWISIGLRSKVTWMIRTIQQKTENER